MTARVAAALAILVTGFSLSPAQADHVPQENTWGSPRALIAAGSLNVRAEPSLGAPVIAVLPRAWPVAVLEDSGTAVTINGQPDLSLIHI